MRQNPTAVGSGLVVIDSPSGNGLAGRLQRFKPVLIQTLIAQGSVDAFDVGVLRGAARLDQDVFDAVLLCPGHKCPASEFRSVVGPDLFWVVTKRSRPVQLTGDVMPSNAEVCCDVHALMAEVVCHRQAFDAP